MPPAYEIKAQLLRQARLLGFCAVGVAEPRLPDQALETQRRWLHLDCAGDMQYLARQPELRFDARSLLPECRSVVVLAMQCCVQWPVDASRVACRQTVKPACVARFAWGDDYHRVLGSRARELGRWLDARVSEHCFKVTVDSSPLAEKAFAVAAGLGWQGRHTLVLNREQGSLLVLACLLTSAELPLDQPQADGCGGCRRCIDACPVNALSEDGWLRADVCLSYVNSSRKLQAGPGENLHGWLYGCDTCQEACPYNLPLLTAPGAGDAGSPLQRTVRAGIADLTAAGVLALNESDFTRLFGGTSIAKRGLAKLRAAAQSIVAAEQSCRGSALD